MEKGRGKGTDTLQTDNVFTRKEYIEREALLADIEACVRITSRPDHPSAEIRGANKVISRIEAAPAADVVSVRHGRWKPHSKVEYPVYHCSVCGGQALFVWGKQCKSDYCPSCGARMDMGTDCTPDKDGDGDV